MELDEMMSILCWKDTETAIVLLNAYLEECQVGVTNVG